MTQAYPQFTPVQILEAGQRAMSEGRAEHATQFFQHLIDHYANTAEAAGARDAVARMNQGPGNQNPGATSSLDVPRTEPPRYVNGGASAHAQPEYAGPNGYNADAAGPSLHASAPAQNGVLHGGPQLSANGYSNGHANGAGNTGTNGHAVMPLGVPILSQRDGQQHDAGPPNATGQRQMDQRSLDQHQADPRISDMPRHIARHNHQPGPATDPVRPGQATYAAHRGMLPSPEKNYIIGRVISGLLLIIGVLGIFAGIVLIYAAVSDPSIYSTFGLTQPAQALLFSGGVFVASLVMLIASQMATAMFDTADATADLVRLERFRAGDDEDE